MTEIVTEKRLNWIFLRCFVRLKRSVPFTFLTKKGKLYPEASGNCLLLSGLLVGNYQTFSKWANLPRLQPQGGSSSLWSCVQGPGKELPWHFAWRGKPELETFLFSSLLRPKSTHTQYVLLLGTPSKDIMNPINELTNSAPKFKNNTNRLKKNKLQHYLPSLKALYLLGVSLYPQEKLLK